MLLLSYLLVFPPAFPLQKEILSKLVSIKQKKQQPTNRHNKQFNILIGKVWDDGRIGKYEPDGGSCQNNKNSHRPKFVPSFNSARRIMSVIYPGQTNQFRLHDLHGQSGLTINPDPGQWLRLANPGLSEVVWTFHIFHTLRPILDRNKITS